MAGEKAYNDALFDWNGPHGLPRFDRIDDPDFEPAFDEAIKRHQVEVDAIASDPDTPDFDNTVVAMERAGEALSRVSALFWNRAGAYSNETVRDLERRISPRLSRHFSGIGQNEELFARLDDIWNRRDALGLSTEALRLLEKRWKGFVKSGARLDRAGKERLAAINERLALLGARFGQNILADEAGWSLHLTSDDEIAGLPGFLLDAMAQAAREHGHDRGYAVTLSRSVVEPFLTFSERRDLREIAFRAWIARGEGDNDNRPVAAEILALRREKASLLGYESYAALKLEDTMAKTPDAVEQLLMPVWEAARQKAMAEADALSQTLAADGANHALEPWDWRHYAEKRRRVEFDFAETELKPYLQLDNMIEAAFEVARRLFGLTFRPIDDPATWHPDIRGFEVLDADGSFRGVFLADYFARSSKRSGAWASALQSQHRMDGGQHPIICNVMNFARPGAGEPALLSLGDAHTLFHEFGHALHGLLSDVTWPTLAGTNVARDFVELPSQLFEHWLLVPEILGRFATHYRTGEPMPQALVEKVRAARKFNVGFQTVEFTASALVDMAQHTAAGDADPTAIEAETLSRLSMPDEIVMRHRTPHFAHVFAGDGYSAGYYSYMWSEVLDADAFRAFEETGDPFNAEIAERLRAHVYSTGGSVEAEDAYTAFRGRLPTPDAMMEERGLI